MPMARYAGESHAMRGMFGICVIHENPTREFWTV